MLLVPRQLLRAGMTGNVPYYGGRFTPAQAYAASHPNQRPPITPSLAYPLSGGAFTSASVPGPSSADSGTEPGANAHQALRFLLDSGVITQQEYQDLQSRVSR
jgi:hypothetical protein